MTPQAFRAWRRSLGLKQREAAERLGLKRRMVQYYERGDRNGRPVEIPLSVRLACWALSNGIGDYDGVRAGSAAGAANRTSPPGGRSQGDCVASAEQEQQSKAG